METGIFETPHRRALYDSCSTEPISASQGTPYPCSQSDLDDSIVGFYKPPVARRFPEEALMELESFFHPNRQISFEVEVAIFHLQAALEIQDWTPDLIIKAFKDLDTVFFAGKLRGHSTFSWGCASWWDENWGILGGHRGPMGVTRIVGHRKTAIHLNAWGIFLNSPNAKLETWLVTLHEMVHAYIVVMCGKIPPSEYDISRGWFGGHGLLFRRILRAVHERARRLFGI